MKKSYYTPEISVENTADVITTSQYVETEIVRFSSSTAASESGMGNTDDRFFDI